MPFWLVFHASCALIDKTRLCKTLGQSHILYMAWRMKIQILLKYSIASTSTVIYLSIFYIDKSILFHSQITKSIFCYNSSLRMVSSMTSPLLTEYSFYRFLLSFFSNLVWQSETSNSEKNTKYIKILLSLPDALFISLLV